MRGIRWAKSPRMDSPSPTSDKPLASRRRCTGLEAASSGESVARASRRVASFCASSMRAPSSANTMRRREARPPPSSSSRAEPSALQPEAPEALRRPRVRRTGASQARTLAFRVDPRLRRHDASLLVLRTAPLSFDHDTLRARLEDASENRSKNKSISRTNVRYI